MFAYDSAIVEAARKPKLSIADVVETMETIDALCVDGDGLKWFNWLYMTVTKAVAARIDGGGFTDAAYMTQLDVRFARLYFSALDAALSGHALPACWQVLFSRRNQVMTARIQFALAGINAHINRDLPVAILNMGMAPERGSVQHADYTALNPTLDSLVEMAKKTLHVRLLGDALPPVSSLEDTIAAWSVMAAREAAWQHAEVLWHLRGAPDVSAGFLNTLDGLTTVAGKAVMVAVL